jgi:hypothetical protein
MKQTVKEVFYDFRKEDAKDVVRLLSVLDYKKVKYYVKELDAEDIIRVVVPEEK